MFVVTLYRFVGQYRFVQCHSFTVIAHHFMITIEGLTTCYGTEWYFIFCRCCEWGITTVFIVFTSACYRANDEAWLANHVIKGNFFLFTTFCVLFKIRKTSFFFHSLPRTNSQFTICTRRQCQYSITSFFTFVNAWTAMRNEFWIIDCTILCVQCLIFIRYIPSQAMSPHFVFDVRSQCNVFFKDFTIIAFYMNEVRHCFTRNWFTFAFAPVENLTFWLSHFTWAVMTKRQCYDVFVFCEARLFCYARYCFCKGTECIPVRFSFPCAINSSLEYVYIWMHICRRQVFFFIPCSCREYDIRVQACRSHTEVDVD